MRCVIIVAASIALVAGVIGAADAKTSKHKGYGSDNLVQRNVSLPSQYGYDYRPNADFKYGPQADFPQSPPGIGGN